MLPRILTGILLVCLSLPLAGCGSRESEKAAQAGPQAELLIYCGITMVKPMREVADSFEKIHNCRVILNQGGSEDLYQSLDFSRQGDLYFPGSDVYRTRHLDEGLLGDCVYLGFNQASFLVPRGNPKGITPDLEWLLHKDLAVVIGNPESCSIGKQSRTILEKAGIYEAVEANCFTLAADSRNLNKLIREGTSDLMLNWRATAFFEENRDFVEVIDLDPAISPRKNLLLILLTFSPNPELARAYMDYATTPEGRAPFLKFGFLMAGQEIPTGPCRDK